MRSPQSNVMLQVNQSVLDSSLETKIFYVLSTSVFCLTREKGIVPAELR